jgi:hypothetical protein
MCWPRSFYCGLVFVGVLPGSMPAQGVPAPGTRQFYQLQEAVAGKRALVIHANGRQEELAGAWLDPDGMIRRAADSAGVPLGALTAIKVRESGAARGLRIGALDGGLSFLPIGVSMAQDDFFDAGGGEVAMITLVGLGGGALTGALLGAPFHYWKTVYRGPGTVQPVVGFREGAMRLGARVSF